MAIDYLDQGGADGAVIGRSATSKLGFFGTTPTAQADATTAPADTAATNSSPYGFSEAQANAIVTWIRAVDAELKAKGLIASS